MLSRQGNTLATWTLLFDKNRVSGAQLLNNLRSLVLLNVPIDIVRRSLLKHVENGTVDLMALMKIDSLFTSGLFEDSSVELIVKQIKVKVKSKGKGKAKGKGKGETKNEDNETSVSVSTSTSALPHIPIHLEMMFRDAKGNVSKQKKTKNIARSFSAQVRDDYRSMLQEVSMSILDQDNDQDEHSEENGNNNNNVVCSIVYTHELCENLLRSGVPPTSPSYTDVSMWRGESLCLESMARDTARGIGGSTTATTNSTKLLAGITWRELEASNPKHSRVDLDLSVMLFDASFVKLGHCSYSQKISPGCVHSGDITSAPYNGGGAREDILLSLEELPPNTRYIALLCYNFTNQSLETCCSDASVFVADPSKKGTGPGGLYILSAAALKCKTTNNLAGILDLDCYCVKPQQTLGSASSSPQSSLSLPNVRRLMCCDQELLKAGGVNCETTEKAVAETMKNCLEASGVGKAPSKPKLSYLAAIGAVCSANVVLIESGGYKKTDDQTSSSSSSYVNGVVTKFVRGKMEKRSNFFQRLWKEMMLLSPVIVPSYDFAEHIESSIQDGSVGSDCVLLLLGGELEVQDVKRIGGKFRTSLLKSKTTKEGEDDESKKSSGGGDVCVVNLRSNQETMEQTSLSCVDKKVWVCTTNTGDVMNSLKNIRRKVFMSRLE
jgi:stress response protein SCP2